MGHPVQDDYLGIVRAALAGRFRIEREIGRGGMATVFLAEDLKHPRKVAIKVLKPELTATLGAERFLREIAIASKLNHPHIVPLHDSGTAGDVLYYVMPYVEGESLRERLARDKQLSVDDAVRLTREAAEALEAAHAQGVVHRDIKPGNILLEAGHAMVADFGLARAIVHAGGDSITSSGLIVGTPEYMSPEQASGVADLDARTDVYSLGCVLYEMLAGEAPYTGPTAQTIVAKQMSQPVPSVRVVRASVSPALDGALRRALAKVPADRYSSAREFADALTKATTARRVPTRFALALAAVLAVGGGATFAFVQYARTHGASAASAADRSVARVAVLPIGMAGVGRDSARAQLVQSLLVTELSRYRGLDVADPASVTSRLGTGAAAKGTDLLRELPRLGFQYGLRLTATTTAKGVEVVYELADAARGAIVESGSIVGADEAALQSQVRQAAGRMDAALDLAAGGINRAMDVEPLLVHRPKPEAVQAFLQGIEYTYRFLPGGAEYFNRAATLDHDFIAPRIFLVSALAERGDTAAAKAQVLVLDSLKQRGTPFEQALISWAEAVVRGDADGKIRHLRVARGYSPHNNGLLFSLASELWDAGRPLEAAEPVAQAMESGWRYGPLYTLYAMLGIDAGRLDGLRDSLEAEAGFATPDPFAAGLLEALALYQGDTIAAARYGAAFRAATGEARAAAAYTVLSRSYRSLAQLARSRRQLGTAVALLRRAAEAGVQLPILRLELARDLAEHGDRRDAEAYYREVAAHDLGGADALAVAGDVAELLGHGADARRYYARYMEVAPNGPEASRVRERLQAGAAGPP